MARKQVCLEALIFHRLPGLVPTCTLDINPEGALIRAEHLALPVHACITLTFALDTAARRIIQQSDAMIIHRSGDRYGLMFKDTQFETLRAGGGMRDAA